MLSMYRKTCLFLLILIFYGCPKEDFSDNCISYSFNTNGLHFYPESDSIKVGDTLWVTYLEPLNPIPIGEKDTINIRGLDLPNYFRFSELSIDTSKSFDLAIDSFILYPKYGKIIPNINGLPSVKYFSGIQYEKNNYLNVAIVARGKGDFMINTDIAIGNRDKIVKNGKCYKYQFITPISNSDNHINKFKSKYNLIIDDTYKNNVYCFTVY